MAEQWYTVIYPSGTLQLHSGGFPLPEDLTATVNEFFGSIALAGGPVVSVQRQVLPGDGRGDPKLDVMIKVEGPESELDDRVTSIADQLDVFLCERLGAQPPKDERQILFQGRGARGPSYLGSFDPPGESDQYPVLV